MKSQFNILKLVYPPISNQYAEWIKDVDTNIIPDVICLETE